MVGRIKQSIDKWATSRNLVLFGLLLVTAGFVPYLLLGKGSVITVNDQLDGEIFTYIYQAAYLFSGQDVIGEWMNGIGKEALFPPSILTVILYRLLPVFAAFMFNQLIVVLTAFLGMNAFLKKLTGEYKIAFVVALLFAYLPFYSVYGLTIAGLPMLAAAFWELSEPAGWKSRVRNILLVLFYGLLSSFVLLGYAVIGCLVLYCIILLFRRMRRQYCGVYLAALLLILWYAVCNLDLITQVLKIGSVEISHKTEYVLHAIPFAESFWSMLLHGSGHAPSYHGWMLVPVIMMLTAGALMSRHLSDRQRREYGVLAALYLTALCIAAFYAWFHAPSAVSMRQSLGGFFVYFQFDRIYWFYPFLWYVMLALMLSLLLQCLEKRTGWKRGAVTVCLLAMIGIAALQVMWHSDFKRNVRQLIGPQSSNAVTWEKYYGEEVFTQIAEAIGREQSSYRVGSVALNPAAAAYNGFYTIDGYSNNYSLEYKHEFRKVIAGELEKDDNLRRYFDEWGNRCYLFTAQLGQNYYYEKDTDVVLSGLEWNMETLRGLGCEYLFSGVEIADAGRMGMELLGRFEGKNSDCRYRIWVYEVEKEKGRTL